MSYPPPFQGSRFLDSYASATPSDSSTPHIPQSAQLPGGYTQWEQQQQSVQAQDPSIHDYHGQAHTGLSHSPLDPLTPMQTPTSTSFQQMEIELDLEEPPLLVPSQQGQPHRLSVSGSHHGSPVDTGPILLHHPLHVQQSEQQYQQQQPYQYGYLTAQQQQQFAMELNAHLQQQQQQYQQLSRPPSATLFHPPPPPPLPSPSEQQPVAVGPSSTTVGPIRSATSSGTRAAAANPYLRRTSSRGGSIPPPSYIPPPPQQQTRTRARASRTSLASVPESMEVTEHEPLAAVGVAAGIETAATSETPVVQIPEAPTTRRTRSASAAAAPASAKPKPGVRFEEGTKTTSRAPRRGSTSSAKSPAVPTAKTTTTASSIASPIAGPSGTGRATRSTADSSRPSATRIAVPQPPTLPPPPPPPPPPSTTLSALPASSSSTPLQEQTAAAAAQTRRLPHTSIPMDMQYSRATHILTASLELPGVKRSDLYVALGTCYFNHIKYVTVAAKSLPVFGLGGGRGEWEGMYVVGGEKKGGEDVDMRKEEEEEEEESEEGGSQGETKQLKTEIETPTPTQNVGTPLEVELSEEGSDLHNTDLGKYGLPKLHVPSAPGASPSTQKPPSQNKPQTQMQIKGKGKAVKTAKITTATSADTAGKGKTRSSVAGGSGAAKVGVGRIVNPNMRERRFGIMRRVIQVPGSTTLSHISAGLADGVLTLQIDCGPPFEIDDEVEVPVR